MPSLKSQCTVCGKNLVLLSQHTFGTEKLLFYRCGHAFVEDLTKRWHSTLTMDDFISATGSKEAYDYQKDGISFIHETDFNALVADPMGLGKTIQAILAARSARNPDGSQRFKKILVLVKAATTFQWLSECREWYSQNLWSSFLIQGTKGMILPGFQIYICSMDTFSRYAKIDKEHKRPDGSCNVIFNRDWTNFAKDIDLLIIDECHSFKNTESNRSRVLVSLIEQFGIEHKVLLSGTPIKNRADEYFIPLNLLRPRHFTSLSSFRYQWLDQDPNTKKYTRIKRYKLDDFQELTKDFILRREKRDVLQNLPPFRRTFEAVFCDDENLKKLYNQNLTELEEITRNGKFSYWDISDNLMTLRRITGLMKVPFALEYIETFLECTEDNGHSEKIAIGVHHIGVRDALYASLTARGHKVLKISGEDSAEQKEHAKNVWRTDPSYRVLIVQMLAGGVGLNLQTKNCQTMLGLEREWNAADEEQFEGRFWGRAELDTMPPAFLAEYMIVDGTVDLDFCKMVEKKRQICGETLDGWEFTNDPVALRELVEKIVRKKL